MGGTGRDRGMVAAATQPSKLLPVLFEGLAVNRRLTILDVGCGVDDTIGFFSQFQSRLYFADLYDEDVVRNIAEDATEDELVEQFTAALDLPDGTQFDICLFWDFFNYLDGPALRGFVEALRPYVHDDTRSHGFGMLNAKTVLNNNQYGIRHLDLLSYRRRDKPELLVYPHSQRELIQLLGNFLINKSRLMVDGRLEFVLRYRAVLTELDKRPSVFGF